MDIQSFGSRESAHEAFAPIFRPSMFWSPERDAPSAWVEHVPFAFWLVDVLRPRRVVELGTHNGVSYSAICQAVKTLALATSCFAIDTWKGDAHASFYGEDVYRDFAAFHDRRYSAFSQLVRSTFDDALRHFEDESIDLLHIDGLHTYEAVRHDYESWLPKLAANAVVLFHDTNVRERDFGVFRLWNEIAAGRHHFSFLHGYGLGVLGCGEDYPDALRALFGANEDRRLAGTIRETFATLGRSVRTLSEKTHLEHQLALSAAELDRLRRALGARDDELAARDQRLSDKDAEIRALRASTSWRITAPLRAANRLLTRLAYSFPVYPFMLVWQALKGRSLATLRNWRAERLISRSGLFDRGWYLANNVDVRELGINPLRHYLVFGAEEGRDPGPSFSSRRYLADNADVAAAGMNPLAHYVLYGAAEGRACGTELLPHRISRITRGLANGGSRLDLTHMFAALRTYGLKALAATVWRVLRTEGLAGITYRMRILKYGYARTQGVRHVAGPIQLRPRLSRHVQPHSASVDIVICVHNALEDVRLCLTSLAANTTPPYRLIIVDDGSDEPTSAFLRQHSAGQPQLLLRHPKALGYTRAANAGLRSSTAEFVVLLNSDTIVPPLWLDRMVECATSDERIGMVGPLSNTASWQSVPKVSEGADWSRNPLPAGIEVGDMASLVSECSVRVFPKVGFLNGFCLLVRRALIEDIGYFDDETFGEGYGEENDYCLRATQAGWMLAVAEDTYIYHAQSKSYSDERRRKLYARADHALRKKHDYRIGPSLLITKENPGLAACRARLSVVQSRVEIREELRKKYCDFSVLFLLPVGDAGGGSNVVVTEASALLRAGVKTAIANLTKNKDAFERSYPHLKIPQLYLENDLSDLGEKISGFDAVVGTIYYTVDWLKSLPDSCKHQALGYYVQDFEPYFFDKSDPEFVRALSSYTLAPDVRLFTKTQWNSREVANWTGVSPAVLGPSYDWDLFFPGDRCCGGTTVITAMVRPSSPRRAPALTVAVFERIRKSHGDRVELHVFGCSPGHPVLNGLRKFPNCVFHGKLSPDGVCQLLSMTDIFVDFSEYQAMGLTTLEAMGCGATVLGPVRGGTGEFVKNRVTGLLVDTSDAEACYEALVEVVENTQLRKELGLGALNDAAQYFPERAALAMMKALFDER